MAGAGGFSRQELLIFTIARLLEGCRIVATGASSPIPGAGALLARARSGGAMRVNVLGSTRHKVPSASSSRHMASGRRATPMPASAARLAMARLLVSIFGCTIRSWRSPSASTTPQCGSSVSCHQPMPLLPCTSPSMSVAFACSIHPRVATRTYGVSIRRRAIISEFGSFPVEAVNQIS